MSRVRSVMPATLVHLVCRVLAFLFELAVLIVHIYASVAEGYNNGVKYATVICALVLNANQVVILADHRRRLRHIPPPFVVIADIVILLLLGAGIVYDYLSTWSHFREGGYPPYRPTMDVSFILIYTML
ncbi:hypothetical protein VTI28DRAFT_6137 [Corynascus sepedonium]